MRTLRLSLLTAILLLPLASAHVGDHTGVFSAETDELSVYLQADRLVVKAQREYLFNGTVVSNATGTMERVSDPSVQIEAVGPGQIEVGVGPRPGGFEAVATFPAPGEWSFLVRTEGLLRRVPIHVYPVTSVTMESSNLRTNYHYVERPVNAELYFLDDETSIVQRPQEAASGRLSQLVDDALVDTVEVTLPPGRLGGVQFSRTFTTPGTYVLTVASEELGIGHASLPEIHFRVQERLVTASPAQTPALGLLGILAIAAALALARKE